MNAADRLIRWSTTLAVFGVAAIAAVVSFERANALVRAKAVRAGQASERRGWSHGSDLGNVDRPGLADGPDRA